MIQLTQRAASHVQQMLLNRGHGLGLRLATRNNGCSGFSYEVNYADKFNADDSIFESFNIKIVIDKSSLPIIDGSEVDYRATSATKEGFEFHNPNVQDVCGCGESFKI